MKNNPHPDRTAEATSLRDELSHQPTVIRSLDALAREEQSEVPIPPIPDELREQWQDRFGVARQAVAEQKRSWFAKISQLWLYGGVAATAVIAVLLVLKSQPPQATPNNPPILRGGGEFKPMKDTMTVFIGSESIPFQAFFVTRQAQFTMEAATLDSAIDLLKENKISSAVILDASNGRLHPWTGGLLEPVNLIEITTDTDEFDLSEALDGFLKE